MILNTFSISSLVSPHHDSYYKEGKAALSTSEDEAVGEEVEETHM